jgi:hypothetical protein
MTMPRSFARRRGENVEAFLDRVERQNVEARKEIAERRRREAAPREATLASLEFPELTEAELREDLEQGGLSAQEAREQAARIIASKPSGPGDRAARALRASAARAGTPEERAAKISRAEELEARAVGITDPVVKRAQKTAEKRRTIAQETQKKTLADKAQKATAQAKQSTIAAAILAKEATATAAKDTSASKRQTAQDKLRKEGFGIEDGFNLDLAVRYARSPNNAPGITPQMLEDAGFTRKQITDAEERAPTQATLQARAFTAETRAKQVAALQKIGKYKEGENRYDISAALADGVSAATLKEARFSASDIREAVKLKDQLTESALTTTEKGTLRDAGLTTKEIDILGQVQVQFSGTSALSIASLAVAGGSAMTPVPGARLVAAAALLLAIAAGARIAVEKGQRRDPTQELIRNYRSATAGLPKDGSLPKGIKATLVASPGLRTGSPPLIPVKPPPLTTTTPRGTVRKVDTLPGFDITKGSAGDRILTAATAELGAGVKEEPKTDALTEGLNKKYREQLEALLNGAAAGVATKQQAGNARYRTNQQLRRRALEEARKVHVASGGAAQLPRRANVEAIAAAILGQAALILQAEAAKATRGSTEPVVESRGTVALRIPRAAATQAVINVTKPATAANVASASKATIRPSTVAKTATKAVTKATAKTATPTATATRTGGTTGTASQTVTQAKPATTARPTTGRPFPLPPPFRLPGDKSLAKGRYPREVTWLQGFTRITVDLDTGKRQTRHVTTPGAPRGTFKVTRTDRTPPKAQTFDLGFENIVVTGKGIRFRLERRKTRGGMPKPRMGRR